MVVTFRDRLSEKDLAWRMKYIEANWGVGEDFVYGVVTREDYGRIMNPLRRQTKKDFRRTLGYSKQCMTHLEGIGEIDNYLQSLPRAERVRNRLLHNGTNLDIASEERQVSQPRSNGTQTYAPKRDLARPKGEFEIYLFGEIGEKLFTEFKSGEISEDLAAGIADIRREFHIPRNFLVENHLARGRVNYKS